MFGLPVSINFKGEKIYRSNFGGILSIITMIVLIVEGGQQLSRLVNYKEPNISTTTTTAKVTELGIQSASNFNVDIAFAVLNGTSGLPVWYDETFYTLEARTVRCLDPNN